MRRHFPSLSALAAFETAARYGSFTRAAEELCVTQSAVSRQVDQIEKFLGVRLFERVRKRVVLTESGAQYAKQLGIALDRVEAATRELLTSGGQNSVLHIASLSTFASSWLAPRLVSFANVHPNITFELTTFTYPIESYSDEVDVFVHCGEPSWPGGVVKRLMDEAIVPMCSPSYAAKHKLESIDDLGSVTLLQQKARPHAWSEWFAFVGHPNISAKHGPRFEQYAMVIEAALAGLGVGAIPRYLAEDHLAAGRLMIPFDRPLRGPYSYYLVSPDAKSHLPKVESFSRWIIAEAKATERSSLSGKH